MKSRTPKGQPTSCKRTCSPPLARSLVATTVKHRLTTSAIILRPPLLVAGQFELKLDLGIAPWDKEQVPCWRANKFSPSLHHHAGEDRPPGCSPRAAREPRARLHPCSPSSGTSPTRPSLGLCTSAPLPSKSSWWRTRALTPPQPEQRPCQGPQPYHRPPPPCVDQGSRQWYSHKHPLEARLACGGRFERVHQAWPVDGWPGPHRSHAPFHPHQQRCDGLYTPRFWVQPSMRTPVIQSSTNTCKTCEADFIQSPVVCTNCGAAGCWVP